MIGLGAHTLKNDLSERYMGIAESLTSTCHEAYDRTATKLGPEAFRFTEAIEAKALKSNEKYYILRPEVIESYFIMWRLTKQQKFRDWGWEAVQVKSIFCISFEKSVFPAFYRTKRPCTVFTRAPCWPLSLMWSSFTLTQCLLHHSIFMRNLNCCSFSFVFFLLIKISKSWEVMCVCVCVYIYIR